MNIQMRYTQMYEVVLNELLTSFISHCNLLGHILMHFNSELITGGVWSPGSSGCI